MTQIRGIVVLDPGHGGKQNIGGSDANHAVSPSGMLEKNLTLQIAQEAEAALASTAPNIRIVKTRSTDVNLSLAERANVARDNKADLFVSIHFNGFNASRARRRGLRPNCRFQRQSCRRHAFAQLRPQYSKRSRPATLRPKTAA